MTTIEDNKEMSFWDHLEELRWVFFRTAIALIAFAIVGFIFMPYIFQHVVMAPTNSDFILYRALCTISGKVSTSILPDFCNDNFHVDIININLASQFFTHITCSFWLAFILACPYLVFEVWRFISPALYKHEKKEVRAAFFFGTIMFFIGCVVGYFLVFPMTFRFLAEYQLSDMIRNQISLNSYMDNFFMLILIMGLMFELPLVSWLLSKLGLVTKTLFRKYRRHAVVVLMILAAIITPSGDPFTLAVVFFPLYILYEISCFFVKDGKKVEAEVSVE